MKPIEEKVVRAVRQEDEAGKKKVEKIELDTHNRDTIKYVEKKLMNKGVQRLERHPSDGIGIGRPPPKSGHGGKYTWEGPADEAENELTAPAAVDEKDPNYVDEEERGKEEEEGSLVIGEVEVPKVAEEEEGVARVEVDPRLKAD